MSITKHILVKSAAYNSLTCIYNSCKFSNYTKRKLVQNKTKKIYSPSGNFAERAK